MPLPNCGYFNKEEKKTQELVFESPPEIVEESDSDEGIGGSSRSSSSGKRIRAKVTTGKLGIELERKMVIHTERDPEVWKKPNIDESEIELARKVSSPNHQKMRSDVRSTIGTFISGNKVDQIRSEEEHKKASFAEKDPVASSILKKEGHLEPAREETITAVRIQPTGIYCCGGKHNSRNHPGGVQFSVGGKTNTTQKDSKSGSTSPNLISVMTATKQIAQSVSSRRVSGASSYSSSSYSTN